MVTVDPGKVKCLEAHVRADVATPCPVRFALAGEAMGWTWVYPESCELAPGEEATVGVYFKPLCGPVPTAGRHRVALHATSATDPATAASADAIVEVTPYREVVAVLDPVVARDQESFTYTVRLENQGNVGMRASLSADQDAKELLLAVDPTDVSAEPGEIAKAAVRVNVRKTMRKGERRYPICVRARVDSGTELRADGAFHQLGRKGV